MATLTKLLVTLRGLMEDGESAGGTLPGEPGVGSPPPCPGCGAPLTPPGPCPSCFPYGLPMRPLGASGRIPAWTPWKKTSKKKRKKAKGKK